MAKKFFYACAGILCLMFAYHLGASGATAQSSSGQIKLMEGRGTNVVLVTSGDDIYVIDPAKLNSVSSGPGWSKFRLDAVK